MDLEAQLRERVKELQAQRQKAADLIQNLNREVLILDGMMSEAVNTINSIVKSKEPKSNEKKDAAPKRKRRKS